MMIIDEFRGVHIAHIRSKSACADTKLPVAARGRQRRLDTGRRDGRVCGARPEIVDGNLRPKGSERLGHDCHATDVLREDLTNDGRVLRQGRRGYPIEPTRFRGLSRECDERLWQMRMPWRTMTMLGTSHARSLSGHESSNDEIPGTPKVGDGEIL
jgi:hypothetical protein